MRRELAASHTVGLPKLARRYESSDGTKRYLLELEDRRTIEAVLMPEQGRDTICISTQVGCPVDCKFCMTALMGLERNLTAGEIVGQVLFVARDNGLLQETGRLNVVMMGMGEPLLNLASVIKATRLLTDPEGVGLSPRRIKALQNIQRWRGIEQFQHLNYELVRVRLEHLYRLARIALHHFCKQLP